MKPIIISSRTTIFLSLLLALTLPLILTSSSSSSACSVHHLVMSFISEHKFLLFSLSWCTLLSLLAYYHTRPLPLLLLDYSCYRPDADRRCTMEAAEYFGRLSHRVSPASEAFMRHIHSKSGIGDETYGPPYIFQTDHDATFPNAAVEAREGMFGAIESLLSKAHVHPSEIDVVIVACSVFCPTPSHTSHVVNRFGFRPDVKTFNLSGMGCSAGTLGVDTASRILRRRKGNALLVLTESTSMNWYFGEDRHMLVTVCIFRVGTAAVLLTSDPARREDAKMELVGSLRTHHGSSDAAYNAAIQREDEQGLMGIALTKDLVKVAGAGLKDHIRVLAPRVLPVWELLRYALLVSLSWLEGKKEKHAPAVQQQVPDFTKAFEHMCIHTGGKAVIDAVGRIMGLGKEVTEPARMTLHRFGNTSSSLVYYQLAYMEAKGRIRKGDRVWVLAFGTGFKACSVVWRALRDHCPSSDNPWNDCVHRYPVC